MDEDFKYLAQRAELFLKYLDLNGISTIFPEREKSWDDLKERINSGSKRRLKILNNIIDNILLESGTLPIEHKYSVLDFFNKELSEPKDALISKKMNLFSIILSKGIIESRLMINDAIAIQNSDILDLTFEQKQKIKEIIILSLEKRIEKLKNTS